MLNRRLLAHAAVAGILTLSLVGGVVTAQTATTRVPAEVQAGTYKLDPGHGKITWQVNHLGFSTYVGQFINVSADLTLDPANPSASTLTATVPLTDVAPNDDGLKRHLQTPDFFDTAQFPIATFVATSIVVDEDDATEAEVTGNLTLHGVTRPVTLEVEFNQAGPSMGNTYKVGFDGKATIRRSEFGMSYGLPAIGDEVELHIEGEFVKQ
ncbi:YceI family protein [Brevundimonas staleyi]|uniref:YceI family protein n=1 Tax=Brevundimonas staleyi TaxID=74326 RepID=A0ABW0FQM0_9CAUL